MNCKLCKGELPPEWSAAPIHFECYACEYCNEDVQPSDIDLLLRTNDSDEPLRAHHRYCHDQKLEADFKNRPVVVTQEHLDMLNRFNLMFSANLGLSIDNNQKDAEIQSNGWMGPFIHERRLEELFLIGKRLEAVAAMISIVTNKEKIKIQNSLRDLQRVKDREAMNADERIEIEKDRIKKREREAIRLSPEKRAEQKSIDAMMKIGMSREQAEAIMESNKGLRKQ